MKQKKFYLSIVAVIIGLIYALATQINPPQPPNIPAPAFANAESYPVERVVDGDTIIIRRGGEKVTIRLKGVNTPESVHPEKPVEAYGKEASRFTTNLLKGERVFVVGDKPEPEFDRFGRLLAYVYRAPDGLFVNAEIIRQGYGNFNGAFPFKYKEEFRQLERLARDAGRGLWGKK